MKKILYILISVITVISASSCSKQCVQCQAVDKTGVLINQSNVICEYDLNRKNFEKRYEQNFSDYTVTCANH